MAAKEHFSCNLFRRKALGKISNKLFLPFTYFKVLYHIRVELLLGFTIEPFDGPSQLIHINGL